MPFSPSSSISTATSRSCRTTSALKWLSLVAVIWLQSINGTNSNFPTYSSHLKDILSMSQIQLNNLAFASDAGKLLGWISGLAALYLPLWLVLMAGSTIGLIGYGVQYLIVSNANGHSPQQYSYWTIFLLNVVAGNSICWINTVCYIVTIRTFGSVYSQVAVGLSTSYQGLSAKIYNGVVDARFPFLPSSRSRRAADSYLILNSALPLLVSLVAAPIIGRGNSSSFGFESERAESSSFAFGFVILFTITIATGAYAVVSSLGLVASKLSPMGNAMCMGIFLAAPLSVPVCEKIRQLKWWEKREMNNKVYDDDTISISSSSRIEEGMSWGVMKEDPSTAIAIIGGGDEKTSSEVGVRLMVKRVDFWLYFFMYALGATLGLVYLNNLGQIAESRGYSRISSLVSLSSSFGFFGRLIPSLADYFLPRSMKMVTRPMSIVALMVPMPVAFLILVTSPTTLSLYVSTAIIGVCTGAITSVSVSLTAELFGTKNFSVNHNVVVANIPIGSFVFGYLAAYEYHKRGRISSSSSSSTSYDGKCVGAGCYGTTFLVWGALSLVGTFLAIILYARTKNLYMQRVIDDSRCGRTPPTPTHA